MTCITRYRVVCMNGFTVQHLSVRLNGSIFICVITLELWCHDSHVGKQI